jgi:hypothetical protein
MKLLSLQKFEPVPSRFCSAWLGLALLLREESGIAAAAQVPERRVRIVIALLVGTAL